MLLLILGGAASGKSELAEGYCRRLGGPLVYVATMMPHGEASLKQIARHRKLRAGKSFKTVECFFNLAELRLPAGVHTVLLECVGNLAANEQFESGTQPEEIPDKVLKGVEALQRQAAHVVVVTNDIFGGALKFGLDIQEYVACMGEINRRLANKADFVVEAVCGLELILKGKGMPREECG